MHGIDHLVGVTDFSPGLALDIAWTGAAAVAVISVSSRNWPNIFGRDMFEERYGRGPNPVRPSAEAGSSKSHRMFASSAGGHVARSVGHLQQLVGHGAGSRQQLLLG
jgi:hypothetical protein